MYYEHEMEKMLQQVVVDPDLQMKYFLYSYSGNPGTSEGETQNLGSLGRLIL